VLITGAFSAADARMMAFLIHARTNVLNLLSLLGAAAFLYMLFACVRFLF
jgi:hypothetical protein